jgi:hypothetical protein
MRLPAPILEHPIESAIAGLLLVALLFVSADPKPAGTSPIRPAALAEKM